VFCPIIVIISHSDNDITTTQENRVRQKLYRTVKKRNIDKHLREVIYGAVVVVVVVVVPYSKPDNVHTKTP